MGEKYSIERIGEMGEPWGAPHSSFLSERVDPSPLRTVAVRELIKDTTHLINVCGHPCCRSLRTSLFLMTMSKAPSMSSVNSVATSPLAKATSTSWIRHATRSVADLLASSEVLLRQDIVFHSE